MINTVADTIVDVVRYGHRKRAWLSALALVAVLVIATGYLLVGALRVHVANQRVLTASGSVVRARGRGFTVETLNGHVST